MDLYVAVVIVVSIIGLALIVAITWLVYKWRQTVPADRLADEEDGMPPMQRLVVERGRVVPAASVERSRMSVFSTLSSVRFSIMSRRKSTASRRATRQSAADSRLSARSHVTYIDDDAPPLPGMPPQAAQLRALEQRAANRPQHLTVDKPYAHETIAEESPAVSPATTRSAKSTKSPQSLMAPPNSPLAIHHPPYASLAHSPPDSAASSRRNSLNSKYRPTLGGP